MNLEGDEIPTKPGKHRVKVRREVRMPKLEMNWTGLAVLVVFVAGAITAAALGHSSLAETLVFMLIGQVLPSPANRVKP